MTRADYRVGFRVDGATFIGLGHVMRCITLAGELRERGAAVTFVCRAHPGHAGDLITDAGFGLGILTVDQQRTDAPRAEYADWLGGKIDEDASETGAIFEELGGLDLLVVDHYAIDDAWETHLRSATRAIAVIDDLANRRHDADLLLDQNIGRKAADYSGLVPGHCQVLAGPQYALMRPAFARHRPATLQRRQGDAPLRKVLISIGSMDVDDFTSVALRAVEIANEARPAKQAIRADAVLSSRAPHLPKVAGLIQRIPGARLHVDLDEQAMARATAQADLAIGAAGSTALERCALGLPTLFMITAENQRHAAGSIDKAGAGILLGWPSEVDAPRLARVLGDLLADRAACRRMSDAAAAICDGRGLASIADACAELMRRKM